MLRRAASPWRWVRELAFRRLHRSGGVGLLSWCITRWLDPTTQAGEQLTLGRVLLREFTYRFDPYSNAGRERSDFTERTGPPSLRLPTRLAAAMTPLLDTEVMDALVRMVTSRDGDDAWLAGILLVGSRPEEVSGELFAAANGQPALLRALVYALEHVGDGSALEEIVRSPHHLVDVQRAARWALARLLGPEALPALADSPPEGHVEPLELIRDTSGGRGFGPLLSHPSRALRRMAIDAVADGEEADRAPLLLAALARADDDGVVLIMALLRDQRDERALAELLQRSERLREVERIVEGLELVADLAPAGGVAAEEGTDDRVDRLFMRLEAVRERLGRRLLRRPPAGVG